MVDATTVVETAIDSVAPDTQEHSINVHLETRGNTTLLADRNELEIIMNNLVSNAVKYNREGGEVFITVSGSDESITICVRDTGIGMTK